MKPFPNIIPALFIAAIAILYPINGTFAGSSGSVTVTVNVTESISISPPVSGFLEVRNNATNGCLIFVDDGTYLQNPLSSDKIAVDPGVQRVTVVPNI